MCSDSAAMDKIFLWVLIVVVTVEGVRKHHPKFPKDVEDLDYVDLDRVVCSREHENKRDEIMEKSNCGQPKEVFITLKPPSKTQEISPSAVWVKRCVGLCEYSSGSNCIATESRIINIPVRVYNEATEKEGCALYPVEEHVSCGCCSLSPSSCGNYKVLNPRKCACQCPHPEERRRCLKQRSMKWNRSRCVCEQKRIHGYPIL